MVKEEKILCFVLLQAWLVRFKPLFWEKSGTCLGSLFLKQRFWQINMKSCILFFPQSKLSCFLSVISRLNIFYVLVYNLYVQLYFCQWNAFSLSFNKDAYKWGQVAVRCEDGKGFFQAALRSLFVARCSWSLNVSCNILIPLLFFGKH